MPALFPPRANRIARWGLVALPVLAVAILVGLMVWVRTPAVTGEGRSARQPIPFDHRIHVTALRIDCRYCHDDADRGASAGMPPTATCQPCHNQVWLSGPLFEPVRHSMATGRPIPWQRINRLPDFVYFNHAIHATGGIGCESCHGRVDRMAQVSQAKPLTMAWCFDCHRNPESRRRPPEAITTMGWLRSSRAAAPAPLTPARRAAIVTCTACHR